MNYNKIRVDHSAPDHFLRLDAGDARLSGLFRRRICAVDSPCSLIPDALRFPPVFGSSPVIFAVDLVSGAARESTSSVHFGQNHSPSGMVCSGGSRQPK